MEEVLQHESDISEIASGLPGIFFGGVSEPFYQVPHSASDFLHVQYGFYFILQVVVVNNGRRGRWPHLRWELRSIIGSEQQLIEYIVDMPGPG